MKNKLLFISALFISLSSFSQSLPELIKNGNTRMASGNFDAALQDFSNAIKVNEPVVTAYLDKMKKYSSMNEYERSTSDMPDRFIYNHDHALAYFGRGQAYEALGKTEEAFADYDKAVTIDPKYADAICRRGVTQITKGAKDKGCIDLRKAKGLGCEPAKSLYEQNACSGMSGGFVNSGNSKFEAKDYPGALADYTAAIQLNADSASTYVKRAQVHVMMKKYDKAVTDYNKALKIKPDTVNLLFLRGQAYFAADNFKLAFADFSQVVRLSPNHFDAYMFRGMACEGMLNYKSAMYDYSEAIRIRPQDGTPYYKRALANQDAKDNSACKDYVKAAALGIEDAKAQAESCQPPKKTK